MKYKRYGWTVSDQNARPLYGRFEVRKNVLKSVISVLSYKSKFKLYFTNRFRKISRRSSLGFYRNYCLFTYVGRVVFRKFKLSRHVFKYMASQGHLSGMRKASF